MSIEIEYCCQSNIGKLRKINQDNYICGKKFLTEDNRNIPSYISGTVDSTEGILLGVFDGMGGEECGEVASLIASQEAYKTNINFHPDVLVTLEDLCMRANQKICDFAYENNVESTGTTCAMLAFTSDTIGLCNVGDSKIYRLSGGVLQQVSVDHVGLAINPNRKPPLSQNLGIPEEEMVIEPYFAKGGYSNGDIYLICSDGLTDMVPETYIRDVLCTMPMNQAVDTLVEAALANGGRDNVTVIAVRTVFR